MIRFALPFLLLPSVAAAQPADEEALIRDVFASLNPQSIADGVEYCGYVGVDAAGRLLATPPTRGDEGTCLSDDPDMLDVIYASYHTHGNYSPDYASELPSGDDMEGDEAEGIDGWVATPGGRLWYIDTTDMVTFQICGIGCLPADPKFVPGDLGLIEESYSYDDLIIKLDE